MAKDMIENMTVKELRAFLKAAGMRGYSTMKKAELVEKANLVKETQKEIVFYGSICDAYYAITPRELFEKGLTVLPMFEDKSEKEIVKLIDFMIENDILFSISCANKEYIYMGGQSRLNHSQAGQILIKQGAVPYEVISKETFKSIKECGFDLAVDGFKELRDALMEEGVVLETANSFLSELFYRVGTGEPGNSVVTNLLDRNKLLSVSGLIDKAERCAENVPQARYRGHSTLYIKENFSELLESSSASGYVQKNNGKTLERAASKIYPNEPCPCGSGRKYKKCCGKR